MADQKGYCSEGCGHCGDLVRMEELLCEWRDARINVFKWSVGDKELRGAINRLSNAEWALHQYALTLGGVLTESGIANGTASRDTNSLTDGTNG